MFKRTVVALVLGITGLAHAVEISPFVGLERESKADVTFAYLGTDASVGVLNLSGFAKFDTRSSGDILGYKFLTDFPLSKSLNLYTDTDFGKNLKATEAKVGVKLKF
jgi:hypothetical protein